MKRPEHSGHDSRSGSSREPAPSSRPPKPQFPLDCKLSHEQINALPMGGFDGRIHVIRSREDMLRAVSALRKETLLGFDTETRPAFRKGESYPPALLQLAAANEAYLFMLQVIGLPVELAEILADPGIVKAGVAVERDVKELRQLTPFQPAGFIDLGFWAEKHGIQHHGLRGLTALLLGFRIPKQAQLTNWSRDRLPERALRYAATDAWMGRRIYEAMMAHVELRSSRGQMIKDFLSKCLRMFQRADRSPRPVQAQSREHARRRHEDRPGHGSGRPPAHGAPDRDNQRPTSNAQRSTFN